MIITTGSNSIEIEFSPHDTANRRTIENILREELASADLPITSPPGFGAILQVDISNISTKVCHRIQNRLKFIDDTASSARNLEEERARILPFEQPN